jgi:hypothetical protein
VEAGEPLDRGLPVVGADDDRVALQEPVRSARRLEQARDGPVGALERRERAVRSRDVRGVVVVREVEDEEVEAVAGDEPAADGGRVVVDRALEPRADGEARPGPLRLEHVEEEEVARSVYRLVPPVPAREGRQTDRVARPAAVAGEVDRRRLESAVLQRLEDGRRALRDVLAAHREYRVANRAPRADRAHRREGGAVLHHPLLAAVVPDEVRDVVDVGERARGDGRQADRRERGKDARAPAAPPGLDERRERREPALVEPAAEGFRGEPVDDDENELLAVGVRRLSPWREL